MIRFRFGRWQFMFPQRIYRGRYQNIFKIDTGHPFEVKKSKKSLNIYLPINLNFIFSEFKSGTCRQLAKYEVYSMTSKNADDSVININFDTNNNKVAKPIETERFEDTLDAAKVAMVRGIIVGEGKNGDIKLITSIDDLGPHLER